MTGPCNTHEPAGLIRSKNAQRQEGEHVKQKRLVTAIKGIIGAELVLSAAFIPMAHAQTTDQSGTGGASGTSTTSAAAPPAVVRA